MVDGVERFILIVGGLPLVKYECRSNIYQIMNRGKTERNRCLSVCGDVLWTSVKKSSGTKIVIGTRLPSKHRNGVREWTRGLRI